MKNVRTHRDIKLVTTNKRRKYLVLEPNYHTTIFPKKLSAIEMKKIKVKINDPMYLGLSILEIRPKYKYNAKLCYMDSFITRIKTKHVYKDIANDFE